MTPKIIVLLVFIRLLQCSTNTGYISYRPPCGVTNGFTGIWEIVERQPQVLYQLNLHQMANLLRHFALHRNGAQFDGMGRNIAEYTFAPQIDIEPLSVQDTENLINLTDEELVEQEMNGPYEFGGATVVRYEDVFLLEYNQPHPLIQGGQILENFLQNYNHLTQLVIPSSTTLYEIQGSMIHMLMAMAMDFGFLQHLNGLQQNQNRQTLLTLSRLSLSLVPVNQRANAHMAMANSFLRENTDLLNLHSMLEAFLGVFHSPDSYRITLPNSLPRTLNSQIEQLIPTLPDILTNAVLAFISYHRSLDKLKNIKAIVQKYATSNKFEDNNRGGGHGGWGMFSLGSHVGFRLLTQNNNPYIVPFGLNATFNLKTLQVCALGDWANCTLISDCRYHNFFEQQQSKVGYQCWRFPYTAENLYLWACPSIINSTTQECQPCTNNSECEAENGDQAPICDLETGICKSHSCNLTLNYSSRCLHSPVDSQCLWDPVFADYFCIDDCTYRDYQCPFNTSCNIYTQRCESPSGTDDSHSLCKTLPDCNSSIEYYDVESSLCLPFINCTQALKFDYEINAFTCVDCNTEPSVCHRQTCTISGRCKSSCLNDEDCLGPLQCFEEIDKFSGQIQKKCGFCDGNCKYGYECLVWDSKLSSFDQLHYVGHFFSAHLYTTLKAWAKEYNLIDKESHPLNERFLIPYCHDDCRNHSTANNVCERIGGHCNPTTGKCDTFLSTFNNSLCPNIIHRRMDGSCLKCIDNYNCNNTLGKHCNKQTDTCVDSCDSSTQCQGGQTCVESLNSRFKSCQLCKSDDDCPLYKICNSHHLCVECDYNQPCSIGQYCQNGECKYCDAYDGANLCHLGVERCEKGHDHYECKPIPCGTGCDFQIADCLNGVCATNLTKLLLMYNGGCPADYKPADEFDYSFTNLLTNMRCVYAIRTAPIVGFPPLKLCQSLNDCKMDEDCLFYPYYETYFLGRQVVKGCFPRNLITQYGTLMPNPLCEKSSDCPYNEICMNKECKSSDGFGRQLSVDANYYNCSYTGLNSTQKCSRMVDCRSGQICENGFCCDTLDCPNLNTDLSEWYSNQEITLGIYDYYHAVSCPNVASVIIDGRATMNKYFFSINKCCPVLRCNISKAFPQEPYFDGSTGTYQCPSGQYLEQSANGCCPIICPVDNLPAVPLMQENFTYPSCNDGFVLSPNSNGCCRSYCDDQMKHQAARRIDLPAKCVQGLVYQVGKNGCCPLDCPGSPPAPGKTPLLARYLKNKNLDPTLQYTQLAAEDYEFKADACEMGYFFEGSLGRCCRSRCPGPNSNIWSIDFVDLQLQQCPLGYIKDDSVHGCCPGLCQNFELSVVPLTVNASSNGTSCQPGFYFNSSANGCCYWGGFQGEVMAANNQSMCGVGYTYFKEVAGCLNGTRFCQETLGGGFQGFQTVENCSCNAYSEPDYNNKEIGSQAICSLFACCARSLSETEIRDRLTQDVLDIQYHHQDQSLNEFSGWRLSMLTENPNSLNSYLLYMGIRHSQSAITNRETFKLQKVDILPNGQTVDHSSGLVVIIKHAYSQRWLMYDTGPKRDLQSYWIKTTNQVDSSQILYFRLTKNPNQSSPYHVKPIIVYPLNLVGYYLTHHGWYAYDINDDNSHFVFLHQHAWYEWSIKVANHAERHALE